jgi:hypothetical protein
LLVHDLPKSEEDIVDPKDSAESPTAFVLQYSQSSRTTTHRTTTQTGQALGSTYNFPIRNASRAQSRGPIESSSFDIAHGESSTTVVIDCNVDEKFKAANEKFRAACKARRAARQEKDSNTGNEQGNQATNELKASHKKAEKKKQDDEMRRLIAIGVQEDQIAAVLDNWTCVAQLTAGSSETSHYLAVGLTPPTTSPLPFILKRPLPTRVAPGSATDDPALEHQFVHRQTSQNSERQGINEREEPEREEPDSDQFNLKVRKRDIQEETLRYFELPWEADLVRPSIDFLHLKTFPN